MRNFFLKYLDIVLDKILKIVLNIFSKTCLSNLNQALFCRFFLRSNI